MSVRIDVRTDIKRAVAEVQALRKDIDKATYRALNRAIDKVATETGREIRKEYNVRQKAITSALRKRRAHKKSLFARLIVEGVRLGLIEFAARQNRAGTSVKIKVKGGRKTVKSAFIAANTATGYRGVWRRVGKDRYPIRNLTSISVPQAFANKTVIAALEKVAVETFNKNFEQQVRFLSGRI
jgi:hypothetical protein